MIALAVTGPHFYWLKFKRKRSTDLSLFFFSQIKTATARIRIFFSARATNTELMTYAKKNSTERKIWNTPVNRKRWSTCEGSAIETVDVANIVWLQLFSIRYFCFFYFSAESICSCICFFISSIAYSGRHSNFKRPRLISCMHLTRFSVVRMAGTNTNERNQLFLSYSVVFFFFYFIKKKHFRLENRAPLAVAHTEYKNSYRMTRVVVSLWPLNKPIFCFK